ncbi:hypothetical protein IKG68_03115 [Candidatus Saccharibacteria bacterium]|nr:hypothetical protein [Candidatus Saccharibacteria bacterium]
MKVDKNTIASDSLEQQIYAKRHGFIVFLVLVLAAVAGWIISLIILPGGNRYIADLAFALMVWPTTFAALFFFSNVVPYRILGSIRRESSNLFLNGKPLWSFFDTRLFSRASEHDGHEPRHEAAVLAMIALRSYERSELEVGYIYDRDANGELHSWVELEYMGKLWIIDPIMNPGLIVSRGEYCLQYHPGSEREIPHTAFWNYPIVQDFCRLASNPETSFILDELGVFYNLGKPDYLMWFEKVGCESLNDASITTT